MAYWFKHSQDALTDQKILQLRYSCNNMEGYGIFWAILEAMHKDSTGYISEAAIGGLSIAYGVPIETLSAVVKKSLELGLFQKCEHGNIYSNRMIEQKKELAESAENGRKGAKNRWKNRGAIDTPLPTLKGIDGNPNADQIRLDQIRSDQKENKKDIPAGAVPLDSDGEDISSVFAGEVSPEFLDSIKKKTLKQLSLHAIITRRFSEAYLEIMGCKYREQKVDAKHLQTFLNNNLDMTEDLFFKVVNKAKEDKFYRKNLSVRFICNNFSKIEISETNEE